MCEKCRQSTATLVPEFEMLFQHEFETIAEMEISSRKSKSYIQWVQQSLNNILGIGLAVDGDAGKKTKSAIRSFQTKYGLESDGIVGANTEAALIRAGAAAPPAGITNPSSTSLSTATIATIKSNIVRIALQEWTRWGNGNKTEDQPAMRTVIAAYWKDGVGFSQSNLDGPWSAAFISYVVRMAGGASTFRYSGSHSVYAYAAKQNRLANNAGTFMAYHISEIKPQPGDILVSGREGSGLNYDGLDGSFKTGHGDIIVEVAADGVFVIGGNVGNSSSGNRGVTVNKKSKVRTAGDGYLTGSRYDIIIRAGGAAPSEMRTQQNEMEILPEFETLLNSEAGYEYEVVNRKSKDYIKWVQGSLNKILGITLTVDGDAGTKTKSAIRSFQSKNGLEVDGKAGPITEAAIKQALGIQQPGSTAGTTTGAGTTTTVSLGQISVNINGLNTFNYQFTIKDLEWTMKFFEGETGGRISAESAAVFWAMVNRFGIKMSLSPNIWRDFTDFLRQYSTTLQPVLNNKRAAYRHINSNDFVVIGNDYYPINNNPAGVQVRKGQTRRHLTIQAKNISSYSSQMKAFAQSCLTGNTQNPGIGLASEFGDTAVYFRDNNPTLCVQRKAQGLKCPTVAEWENYNLNQAGTGKRWVGNVAGLTQYNVNTFFLNTALIGTRAINVSII